MELKDKIRCNELLKEKHSNWLGLSNQKAIRSMLEELDRLQKENEKYECKIILSDEEYRKLIDEAQKDCINKDKIREKIEERKQWLSSQDVSYEDDYVLEVLQDLLKEE